MHRRMDGVIEVKATECVLLSTEGLTNAAKNATQGGKTHINGLYLPSGKRIESTTEDQRVDDAVGLSEEAQQNLNLAKVARLYNGARTRRHKKAEKLGRTEDELDDIVSQRKAKVILEKADFSEQGLYRDLFDFFDVDKDRTWGSIEFEQRMTDIGYSTNVEEAANLLYFAGFRDVDRITYDDFINIMPKLKAFRKLLEKDAMREFAARDVTGKGWISIKALREILTIMAGPDGIEARTLDRLVKKADREREGKIHYEFFMKALFGTAPVLKYQPPQRSNSLLSLFGCRSQQKKRDESDSEDEVSRL